MSTCRLCQAPTEGKSFCCDSHKNIAWANRRKLGAVMVDLGVISDAQIAAFLAAVEATKAIAERHDGIEE